MFCARCVVRLFHAENYRARRKWRSTLLSLLQHEGVTVRLPAGDAGHNITAVRQVTMSSNEYTQPYADLLRVFVSAHAVTEPAEAHGVLAGSLCATGSYSLEDWLAEVFPEIELDATTGAALRELFEQTRGALLGHDMQFVLLMPDDEQPIEQRTAALCQWCNGFLYGLAGQGAADPERLPGDAGEVVRDIGEITRADVDAADPAEVNESALSELEEFVRVGVQLVYEELSARRQPSRPVSNSIH